LISQCSLILGDRGGEDGRNNALLQDVILNELKEKRLKCEIPCTMEPRLLQRINESIVAEDVMKRIMGNTDSGLIRDTTEGDYRTPSIVGAAWNYGGDVRDKFLQIVNGSLDRLLSDNTDPIAE
jgi:hypothetical protein